MIGRLEKVVLDCRGPPAAAARPAPRPRNGNRSRPVNCWTTAMRTISPTMLC